MIYDAVQSAQARKIDVVLADTAGRLTTQAHLMEEIKKVKRVIAKAMPETQTSPAAPHEVLLVLDANTGQNALSQVKSFDQALGVTGLILTKLDGTAKGGVIAAIAHSSHNRAHPIPVRFIGIGEGFDDLRPFVAEDFVAALLGSRRMIRFQPSQQTLSRRLSGAEERLFQDRRGRDGVHHRTLGCGQEHAAQADRGDRAPQLSAACW